MEKDASKANDLWFSTLSLTAVRDDVMGAMYVTNLLAEIFRANIGDDYTPWPTCERKPGRSLAAMDATKNPTLNSA